VKKNKELKKFTVNEFIKTWIQRLLVKKN
jgi:hypothetical protein